MTSLLSSKFCCVKCVKHGCIVSYDIIALIKVCCVKCVKHGCIVSYDVIALINKGNYKITELRTILQRESQNS